MKRNPYLIRGQFPGIALLAAIALHGCGNRLTEEQEKPSATMENELYCSLNSLTEEQEKPSAVDEVEEPFWYDQYAAVLKDWTLIEDYGDFSYLPMYFGEDYAFDSYWLCDVDQNGVPELFLHSSTMRDITAVFTCTEEQLVFLTYDDFYGINLETGEFVIHGHWHGAGGTYDNEWSAYKVLLDKAEYAMYIDFFDFSEEGEESFYTIYNPETEEYVHSSDGTEYEALYAAHVQPCVPVESYTLYGSSDLSGLDRIQ